MSAHHPLEAPLLRLFAAAPGHHLSAAGLKSKLAPTATKSPLKGADPAEVDRAIAGLVDAGKLVAKGGKAGPHPRPGGSYALSGAGRDHVRPRRPDASDETLACQESYILLQMIRFDGHAATRSALNEKLKSATARQDLEFPEADAREVVDYHLHNLVRAGSLEETRRGVSTIYALTEDGLRALGRADQHEIVEFRFRGAALNDLLRVARGSATGRDSAAAAAPADADPAPAPAHHPRGGHPADLEPRHIHDFVAELRADRFAGRTLVPIHEVRALVARHHGAAAAGHPVFDRLLKAMRGDGDLKIIAIADSRDTPPEHLDGSIPGMNETLFFIDTE